MNTILFIIIFIISGLTLTTISVKIFRKMKNLLSLSLSLLTLSMAVYSFGCAWEAFAKTNESLTMAIKFQYFGLSFLSVYWAIFSYKFKYNRYPSAVNLIFLLFVPLFILFMVSTNELHYLYYKKIELVNIGNYSKIILAKGLLYYIFVIYSYGILINLWHSLFYCYKHSEKNKKKQCRLMLTGTIFPVVLNVFYLLKIFPFEFDLTPIGFVIYSLFWNKAITLYEYLDIKEITRVAAFDRISEGVFIVDLDYRLIDFNRYASNILNICTQKNIGDKIQLSKVGRTIVSNKNAEKFETTIEINKKTFLYEFKKTPVYFRKELIAYMYLFTDITNTTSLITDLTFLASHDFLTGINNKMDFTKTVNIELQKIKKYGGSIALIMFDIDFFKKVNDTYGHSAGDEILKGLVNVVISHKRTNDHFGRLGGEEFGLLLTENNLISAVKFAEKIRQAVEEKTFIVNFQPIKITISLGVGYYSSHMKAITLSELFDLADKALYSSKNNGRNKTSYIKHINEVGDINEYN